MNLDRDGYPVHLRKVKIGERNEMFTNGAFAYFHLQLTTTPKHPNLNSSSVFLTSNLNSFMGNMPKLPLNWLMCYYAEENQLPPRNHLTYKIPHRPNKNEATKRIRRSIPHMDLSTITKITFRAKYTKYTKI